MIVLGMGNGGLIRSGGTVAVAVMMTVVMGGTVGIVAMGVAMAMGRSVAMGVAVVTVGRTLGRSVAIVMTVAMATVAIVMAVGLFPSGVAGRGIFEVNAGFEGTETLAQHRSCR
jgi:hypothetical protein